MSLSYLKFYIYSSTVQNQKRKVIPESIYAERSTGISSHTTSLLFGLGEKNLITFDEAEKLVTETVRILK